MSRDPIEEEGGINLYAYVENGVLNTADTIGLIDDQSMVVAQTPQEISDSVQGYKDIWFGIGYVLKEILDEDYGQVNGHPVYGGTPPGGPFIEKNVARLLKEGKKFCERIPTKKLRKAWENFYKKKWPKDPKNPLLNQDAAHKKALADFGDNKPTNIKPQPHDEHMAEHQKNGDFERWANRNK